MMQGRLSASYFSCSAVVNSQPAGHLTQRVILFTCLLNRLPFFILLHLSLSLSHNHQCDMQKLTVDELKRLLYDTFRDHLTMKDIENIIMTEESHLNSPDCHVDIDSRWRCCSFGQILAVSLNLMCWFFFFCPVLLSFFLCRLHSEPHAAGETHVRA